MSLTTQQKAAVKANILASPDLNVFPNQTDGAAEIAALYNLPASPTFWVWRTDVSREAIYTSQNDLSVIAPQTGFWNWTTFKNQGATEQTAWREMFMGDLANFAKQNLRDGIAAIFTGSGAANAQRDHCLAVGRRVATRLEKLLATGTGSAAVPATMGFEGGLSALEIDAARNS